MDKRMSWLEWAIIIAFVVFIVIVCLVLFGPQMHPIYSIPPGHHFLVNTLQSGSK